MVVSIQGVAMDNFIQYLFAEPKQRPAASPSDQQRLVAKDKRELDRIIELKQRHGWLLVSRSYSMEEGHGATMVTNKLGRAA